MNVEFDQIEDDASFESWLRLREVLTILARGWKIILVCTVVWMLWTAYKVHQAPRVYSAQMIVTAVQVTPEEANAARLNGALGNLAALAGAAPTNNQVATQFRLYVDSMTSRDLANDLARDQTLMKTLFANEWDDETQSWRQPEPGFRARAMSAIGRLIGSPRTEWEPPDGARMQQFLANSVSIDQDPRKAYLVTISYNSTDPDFAISFLRKLNATADNHLRQKALTRARQYIQYLSTKLDTVTVAEHRAAIMNSLSDQEKYEMIASSAAPFAADLFDAPNVSRTPISPQPRRMYMTALLESLLVGAGLAFVWGKWGAVIRQSLNRNRRR